MATVVQKYGGSSVADAERLRGVAAGVVARKRAGNRVVVVVSAMGKTTDALIEQACAVSRDPPRRELDMLVTAGERISMALLSMAIQALGEDAISFTGSQSGIITEDNHQGARILEVRPYRLAEELDRGRIVIVAGYQGVSRQREVTTLGRGGSDTTAVALAAALGAEACEIYSDVDGVYSADPNICPQARLLSEIRYETMQAMAAAGAKVLNADAVEFARRAGIVVEARKTGDTSGRHTTVSDAAPAPSGVVAVVGAKAVSRLRGEVRSLPGLLQGVAALGGRCMTAAGAPLDLWIDRTGVPGTAHGPLAALASAEGLQATPTAAVTLVGCGLLARPALWQQIEEALGGIPVHGRVAGDGFVSLAVDPASCDDAVRSLHAALADEA